VLPAQGPAVEDPGHHHAPVGLAGIAAGAAGAGGACLSEPGAELTFIARGPHLAAMRQDGVKGLELHSGYFG
jgi:hypothetical protein